MIVVMFRGIVIINIVIDVGLTNMLVLVCVSIIPVMIIRIVLTLILVVLSLLLT